MQGTLLGQYRILRQLGQGGMGVVYVGRHEALGHHVVVKVLRPEMSREADMVKRFFNEARAASAIRNPGIAQVFDFGATAEGEAYFVMELLEGETLTARMEQRQLDTAECCRIGRQIANVLNTAHAVGIIHRDLKPDNLFLVPDAEVVGGERVKVLDFGLAKLASAIQAIDVQTRTDLVVGTPSYMSPEQCRGGGGTIDHRADIYSLGCILFRMIARRPPFVGSGPGDIIGAHLHVAPPRLADHAPDAHPGLAELVTRMLQKRPEARPQTMADVGQELDQIVREIAGPPPVRASGEVRVVSRAPTPWPTPEGSPHPAPVPTLPYVGAPPARARSETAPPSPATTPRSLPVQAPSTGAAAARDAPRAYRILFILAGFLLGAVIAAVAVALVLGT